MYCTNADIKGFMRLTQNWDDYPEGPSSTLVDQTIKEIGGKIDTALKDKDMTPPIDLTHAAGLTLVLMCKNGVSAVVARILYGQDGKSKLADQYQAIFDRDLKAIYCGDFRLSDITRAEDSLSVPDSYSIYL